MVDTVSSQTEGAFVELNQQESVVDPLYVLPALTLREASVVHITRLQYRIVSVGITSWHLLGVSEKQLASASLKGFTGEEAIRYETLHPLQPI